MKHIQIFARLIFSLTFALGAGNAFAQTTSGDPMATEVEALRIDGIDQGTLPNDGVSITYDPSEVADAPAVESRLEELKKLSQQMSTEEYKKDLENKVVVPLSVESSEDLLALEKLQPTEVQTFLARKTSFLEKRAKFFKMLHLKVPVINKIVHAINKQFFKNAGVIANANSRVLSLQLGASGGVGFSDWIMAQLRKSPYFANLPERTGFYFLISTGVSIVRTEVDGKNRISIEPVIEFRRSTKILMPFVYGSAGAYGTWTLENRHETPTMQTANFYKVSSLSVVSGLQQYGFSASAAMVFPPGGGLVAGMEGVVYRIRITRKVIPDLMNLIKSSFFRSAGLRCEQAFR